MPGTAPRATRRRARGARSASGARTAGLLGSVRSIGAASTATRWPRASSPRCRPSCSTAAAGTPAKNSPSPCSTTSSASTTRPGGTAASVTAARSSSRPSTPPHRPRHDHQAQIATVENRGQFSGPPRSLVIPGAPLTALVSESRLWSSATGCRLLPLPRAMSAASKPRPSPATISRNNSASRPPSGRHCYSSGHESDYAPVVPGLVCTRVRSTRARRASPFRTASGASRHGGSARVRVVGS